MSSTFHHSPQSIFIKRLVEQQQQQPPSNDFESAGDSLTARDLIEPRLIPTESSINYKTYFYLIYLLLLVMFYIYYMSIILFHDTIHQNIFEYSAHFFANDEQQQQQLPRLFWFRKGYQLT